MLAFCEPQTVDLERYKLKKHIFEIIWLATILVVVAQIIFFVNRKDLPEGLIILEEAGEKNSVHLARSLNHRYLPSTAKSFDSKKSVSEQPATEIVKISEELPMDQEIDNEDQLDYRFTTLPGTQFGLKFTSTGDFEQVSYPEEIKNNQVIENLAIEVEPLKHLKSSDIEEATQTTDQPLN